MKFSTREEIDAPIDRIWAAVTDAHDYEAQARLRGIDVTRHPEPAALGVGTRWISKFDFHGLHRELETSVSTMTAPNMLVLDSHVGGLDAIARVELQSLDEDRTRLSVSVELMPRTIPGKVLVQTLKLAKSTLNDKFRNKVRRVARQLERP